MVKDTSNYISLNEAAKYSGYSQEYLSLRARQGKLRALKVARNWMTKKEWIDEYLQRVKNFKNRLSDRKKEKIKIKIKEVTSDQSLYRAKRIAIVCALVFILASISTLFAYPYFEPAIKGVGNFIAVRTKVIASDIKNGATDIGGLATDVGKNISQDIFQGAEVLGNSASQLIKEISGNISKGTEQVVKTFNPGIVLSFVGQINEQIWEGGEKIKESLINITDELKRDVAQDIQNLKKFGRNFLHLFSK